MRIEIQEIDGPGKSNKGNWQEINLTYTDTKDDSTRTKTLVSFGDGKPVFDALENGEFGPGDQAEVQLKKSGKFWNWVGIEQATGEKPVVSRGSKPASSESGKKSGWTPDPNRETAAERYLKNLAICRQNALTNAINFFTEEADASVSEVLAIADQFFHYTSQDFIRDETVAKSVNNEIFK